MEKIALLCAGAALVALSGCGMSHKGELTTRGLAIVESVLQQELPASTDVFKLYGTEKGTQYCALKTAEDSILAAKWPVQGTPLYVLYGKAATTRYDSQTTPVMQVDVKALQAAVRQCVALAKPADEFHLAHIDTDD